MTDSLDARHRMGANNPPSPTEIFGKRLERLDAHIQGCLRLTVTEIVAAQLRDGAKEARDLEIDLEAAKKKDKQPHLDANTAIEASYRPLVTQAGDLKTSAKKAIDAFLKAEEDRQIAQAAKARMEAEGAAQRALEAQQTTDDPFTERVSEELAREARLAQLAADQAERQASSGASVSSATGIARGTALRSYWSVKVIDSKKLVMAFAKSTAVIEAATKEANALARLQKGSQPIPGCELVEDRRSV